MSSVKILEQNSDQITFKIGEKFNPSVVFIVMVTVLVLGGLMLLVPMWISDIVDGNSSSLFTMLLFVGCFAYIFFIIFCKFYCSLCTFNFKTHQIEVFQESRIRKQQITESIDNFLNLKIKDSSNEDSRSFSVYLALVSKKNIYLGSIQGEREDYQMLDEIEQWIETNK
jgi:ABC-type multidrug transport system fused ATPase/permease subunit